MGRRNGGYGGYRGRRTFHDILKWVAAILAVLVVILAGVLVFGQRYLVFRDQGVRLELPFLHQKDGQQSGPGDVSLEVRPQGDQSDGDQSAQEPGADETKSLRAAELPLSAVQDGTAQDRLEQAGADALILEMKDSQGDLAWQSGESLAALVTTGGEAVNAALEEWNRGDVYTIARVCAFRDNTLPYQDNRVALKAGYGNWRDEEKLRWLDPDSETARAYIVGLCRELAQLGFDEIMLDQCWFPTQGQVGQIVQNGSYADGRFAETVEELFGQISQAVEPYGTCLSVRLPEDYQGADAPGGLSVRCLETYVQRIWAVPQAGESQDELAQRLGLTGVQDKLAALTAGFDPQGLKIQGTLKENET